MRAVLEHCAGRQETYFPADKLLIRECETTGDLFILMEGELEVMKGDTVIAVVTEPGSRVQHPVELRQGIMQVRDHKAAHGESTFDLHSAKHKIGRLTVIR